MLIHGAAYSNCTSPYSLPDGLSLVNWHTFLVKATDTNGNVDPTPAEWKFKLSIYPDAPATSKLVYPEDGKKTASYYTLKAEWGVAPAGGGVTGVTFQMLLPTSSYGKVFKDVPAECVIDGKGEQVSWPLPTTGNPGHTEPVFLKVWGCAPFVPYYPEENIKFRAVFDGGINAAGASVPATTGFVHQKNGTKVSTNAVQSIGPVTLDLVTGAHTISRTDVSIPVPGTKTNLEFTRVYNSSSPLGEYSSMGSWFPSAPMDMEFEGEAWRRLEEQVVPATPAVYEKECWNEEGDPTGCGSTCPPESCEEWLAEEAQPEERWMELIGSEGEGVPYEISGESLIAPDYAKEFKLHREGAENIVLTDESGTHTIFRKNGPLEYLPKEMSFQATPTSARMVYTTTTHEGLRLARIIAPSQTGIPCGDTASITQVGCRTLEFEYLPSSTWQGPGAIWWSHDLASIRYYNATGQNSQLVAKYNYNQYGKLIEVWDPRLPNFKEKYTYRETTFGNLITSVTPPGEKPWEFEYDLGYDYGYKAPLRSVSRASLTTPSKATTTIVYDVPVSGEDAPYDMSPSTVAEWGQSDFPVDATAIFPPSQVPTEFPPSDYSKAEISYMDPDGGRVNQISPSPPGVAGPSIGTSEIDTRGNIVRTLSPENRLVALEDEDPVARSHELDEHSTYSADSSELLESWGPLHEVRTAWGDTVEARLHTTFKYNEGAPQSVLEKDPQPHLVTKTISGASIPGQSGDVEKTVSETKYDWSLLLPTEEIADAGEGGLKLTSKTGYDQATGLVTEERMPAANAGGTDAYTMKTVYYSNKLQSETEHGCGENKAWAGLPCVIKRRPCRIPPADDRRFLGNGSRNIRASTSRKSSKRESQMC